MEYRNGRGYFSEEFRRWAVSTIEAGELSGIELCDRYGIRGHSTLLKWCRRYGGKQYPVMKTRLISASEITKEERQVLILRNQVKALESELKESRMKQATLETLIDIAERHHSISIKKNTGGKRSSK
jgi:transposase-like protein